MSRFVVPASTDGIAVGSQQFEAGPLQAVGADGKPTTVHGVDVPDALDAHVRAMGFKRVARIGEPPVPKENVAKDTTKKPTTDANGLLLDGPTVEEWVAKGYSAKAYPPQGYASRSSAAEVEAAVAGQEKAEAERIRLKNEKEAAERAEVVKKAEELAHMSVADLKAWCVERGIPDAVTMKKVTELLPAAYAFIGYVPPESGA